MTLTNTIAVFVFATTVEELILKIICGDASIKMNYPFSLVANAMLRKIERSAETVNDSNSLIGIMFLEFKQQV